ncbi:hypothetical protein PVK06_019304 [Gossypium arboreum]|uniref:Reverse transcriptase n=1 Tax=Gossypium arboreum TaxID=29729 RepID=A0ABR0PJD0_GOSAR|nr:hypothetical protein PVK06_019304 [Gossypium arboreum]
MTQFGNRRISNRFRFESWWVLEESFLNEVEIIWRSTSSDLLSKLETFKRGLKNWARQIRLSREGIKENFSQKLEELSHGEKDDKTLAEFIDTNVLLNFEIEKDEMYWEQRARVNWLKLGDRNTSFFHKHASQCRSRNFIQCLQYEDGRGTNDESIMEELARNYFQKLFSSNGVRDSDHLLFGIKRCVNSNDNLKLTSIYTKEEVWLALKGMAPTKASVEDGLRVVLLKMLAHNWGGSCSFLFEYSQRRIVGKIFKPTRGIRQGGPSSPFLFLIYNEGLSALMRLPIRDSLTRGAKASRSGLQISHLLFANYCILFGEANVRGAQMLKSILGEYERSSG